MVTPWRTSVEYGGLCEVRLGCETAATFDGVVTDGVRAVVVRSPLEEPFLLTVTHLLTQLSTALIMLSLFNAEILLKKVFISTI